MDGASFVLYILAATLYSTYACIWVRTAFVFAFESNLSTTGLPNGLVGFKGSRQVPSAP